MLSKKLIVFLSSLTLGIVQPITCEYNIRGNVSSECEALKTCVLKSQYTPEAFEQLNDIPFVEGKTVLGYDAHAMGRNVLMELVQNIGGYGKGKKTVIKDEKSIDVARIIHEYTHHASALGLIDDGAFEESWDDMAVHPVYEGVVNRIDQRIDELYPQTLMGLYPTWRTLEREAKLAEEIVLYDRDVPELMKVVYRRTLRCVVDKQ